MHLCNACRNGFSAFPFQVQLQILTAIVKLFLQKPQGTQELVQKTLSLATQVCVL
jgi:hypothetical protein